jgi:ribonuclease BN (tRNA processing enzyme)
VTLALTILGCDGSYPGPGGACSGYLVSCEDTRVWLDAGSGTLARLQEQVALESLDAVVLTHQHPDHWTDVEHLAVALRWALNRPGVPVFAPAGLRSLTRVGNAADVLDWHVIGDGDRVKVGALDFVFSQTDHPVTTLAARVEGGGRSLGYSADSGPGWDLAALGPALDLALCEATFLSDKEGTVQHLSARQAGLTARRAEVGRLVITHLLPRVDRQAARDEAAAAYGRDVTVAGPGDRFAI